MPELLHREKRTTIICKSTIFWLVIQLHGASTAPFAPINGTLRNIVDCAVTDAVSDLTMPVPVDTDTIANNIISKLISGGIEDCFTPPSNDTCKSRGAEFLVRRFLRVQSNARCITLQRVTLPAYINGTTHYSAYVLTGNTSCLELRYHSDCFPRNSQAACSWTQTMKSFGEDHFPEFAVEANCKGNQYTACSTQRNICYYSEAEIPVYGLKREKECDSDGYEIWNPSELYRLKTGCSCLRCQTD